MVVLSSPAVVYSIILHSDLGVILLLSLLLYYRYVYIGTQNACKGGPVRVADNGREIICDWPLQ